MGLEITAIVASLTDLEDWSLSVLVDGNNDLAVLHTSKMLDCSRDPHSNIKFRCDDLPCLTDLRMLR